jgi:hypothetical protein
VDGADAEVMSELVAIIQEQRDYRAKQLAEWRGKPPERRPDLIFSKRESIERELQGRIWELETILARYHERHPDPSREPVST